MVIINYYDKYDRTSLLKYSYNVDCFFHRDSNLQYNNKVALSKILVVWTFISSYPLPICSLRLFSF